MENFAGTWLSVLNHFPSSDPASLDQVSRWKPDPPAEVGWKRVGGKEPFVQGWNKHV